MTIYTVNNTVYLSTMRNFVCFTIVTNYLLNK